MIGSSEREAEIKRRVEMIRGVTGSRIVIGPRGEIEEVHVLATADRNPKQIVRDIESICAADFGLRIDHRKVSVAQLGSNHVTREEARLRLDSVGVHVSGSSMEVHVHLYLTETLFEGRARGPESGSSRPRVAAIACLQAVEGYLGETVRLVLDDLVCVHAGQRRVVLVLVTMLSRGGEEKLAGCVLIKKDVVEASIRAVLDALNRRIAVAGE
ncbi:MAG: hypothetical protein HYY08_03010 [Firmicutes bacterium]|nr:hypothetical protein [Bacillota bacterium]